MQFTFRRDEEGRERIYVGDVCVAEGGGAHATILSKGYDLVDWIAADRFHAPDILSDAIERADEAGFWGTSPAPFFTFTWDINEVIVDVPVADNDVRSVTRVSAEDGA